MKVWAIFLIFIYFSTQKEGGKKKKKRKSNFFYMSTSPRVMFMCIHVATFLSRDSYLSTADLGTATMTFTASV